ncbi:alanine--tRNA ligase [Methanococcoides methylutens]|uniref:Alanine--tRNA ligase n=1 Tax=Methanococcoides methylutens MM1 TaxID=1434104 RepID=A0A0E3SPC1_METMT|nr:alanine--tRNA ligase [Methanococcoides methylutens]AKB84416.1 Alanyl-tRNA synthetase [Methanococcoides methylutens MM1]
MLEDEYQIDFFSDNGFIRKQCPKCGKYFWTRDLDRETCGDAPCDPYSFIGNPVFKKKMELADMRESYLKFFEEQGHTRVDRYPVIARWRDDIYLTIASIADFQPFVTSGQVPPPANPLTISQPCIRLSDLDAVGRSGRHLTTFEMMAHHAFNKKDKEIYWKDQTLELCDGLLNSLGADPMAVTYKEEPWAGGGNAGPCVETLIGGLEVATLVFMDLKQDKKGSIDIKGDMYSKMDNYIVDTGYGLERFVWASKGSPTIYDAIFPGIVNELMGLAGIEHELENEEYTNILSQNARLAGLMDVSEKANLFELRKQVASSIGTTVEKLSSIMEPVESVYAITDHTRCLTFMLGDGGIPSNVKAGYLARLVIRRTLRMMKDLGIKIPISEIVRMHIDNLPEYPEFQENFDVIDDILVHEERKFADTLDRGRRMMEKSAKHYKKSGEKIPLETIIDMYDSHGIPPEISKSVASEAGVEVDLPDNFYSLVADKHSKSEEKEEKVIPFADRIAKLPKTKRLFYDEPNRMEFEGVVLDIFENNIVLDNTLLYPEGGGQPADHGTLTVEDEVLNVVDTQIYDGVVVHTIDNIEDELHIRKGDLVVGRVDEERRMAHARHHTATHIINDAAREVLGSHIWQAGAQKFKDRARLDLSHYKRITQEELDQIELIANRTVMENRRVLSDWMDRTEAEQKYGFRLYQGGVPPGKMIRVMQVGNDIEACAGTHCTNTGLVGPIKILKTERIQDGVERLEYAAGEAAVKAMQDLESLVRDSSETLRVSAEQLPPTIERFFEEWKEFKKENTRLKEDLAHARVSQLVTEAEDINGIKVIAKSITNADSDELTKTAGELTQETDVVAVLISEMNGVKIVAAAGEDAVKNGINVGAIVKEMSAIVGGGGGGRPNMARGGGTDASKMDEALNRSIELLKEQIE